MMNDWQGWLYVAAVLIPLVAFAIELLAGRLLGRLNAYVATAAIATSFALSLFGFVSYYCRLRRHGPRATTHAAEEGGGDAGPGPARHAEPGTPAERGEAHGPARLDGELQLGRPGLRGSDSTRGQGGPLVDPLRDPHRQPRRRSCS